MRTIMIISLTIIVQPNIILQPWRDVSVSSGDHQMSMTPADTQDLKETWICTSSTTNNLRAS